MGAPEGHGPITWSEAACCDEKGEGGRSSGTLPEGCGRCGRQLWGTCGAIGQSPSWIQEGGQSDSRIFF